MPRNDAIRVLPDAVRSLKARNNIKWARHSDRLKQNREIDVVGAIALDAGAYKEEEPRAAFEHCVDTYGRDYTRGLLQGWDGNTRCLLNRRNLENEHWKDGYIDGWTAAVEAGLADSVPFMDWDKLLADSPPHDPEYIKAPVLRIIELERIRKVNRTLEQQLELDVERAKFHRDESVRRARDVKRPVKSTTPEKPRAQRPLR